MCHAIVCVCASSQKSKVLLLQAHRAYITDMKDMTVTIIIYTSAELKKNNWETQSDKRLTTDTQSGDKLSTGR